MSVPSGNENKLTLYKLFLPNNVLVHEASIKSNMTTKRKIVSEGHFNRYIIVTMETNRRVSE